MNTMSRLLTSRTSVLLVFLLLSPATATAQTWLANRQGPSLSEVLAIDATEEPNWLWGAEDVAGDGPAYPVTEQAIDARTAYVATDANRFYSRVYFSVASEQPGNVTTFVFIDTDQNPATGGHAASTSTALGATYPTDPSNGGYEYVIKVERTASDQTTGSVWQYNATTQIFEEVTTRTGQIETETGTADDPLRINQLSHGYVQSSVELALVGLTRACSANVFVRTTNQTAGLGTGDLNMGDVGRSCVPQLDANRVPVVVNPPTTPGCTSNAQCANGGICVNGACIYAQPCTSTPDCPATQACLEGRCVLVGGTACSDSSTCNGLLCVAGRCTVCTSDSACGTGFVCGPEGRCLAGNTPITCTDSTTCNGLVCETGRCTQCSATTSCGAGLVCDTTGRCLSPVATGAVPSDAGMVYVAPSERLQGGACACKAGMSNKQGWWSLLTVLGIAVLFARDSKREPRE
jgi:hypothetical protein